jgi:hypothetical protein
MLLKGLRLAGKLSAKDLILEAAYCNTLNLVSYENRSLILWQSFLIWCSVWRQAYVFEQLKDECCAVLRS